MGDKGAKNKDNAPVVKKDDFHHAKGIKTHPTIPTWLNFVIGGASGMMATCIVQPNDLLKTRLQLLGPAAKKTNMFQVARGIVKDEGIGGLYKGLSAALFRQATYTTFRLGLFNGILDFYKGKYGVPNYGVKLLMGMTAGGIGAYVGTPAEVALIRMTADSRLPPEKRRNYKNVFNALGRIIREEGVTALWRGASATVTRAMVVNAAQLGTYAQAREMLLGYLPDGIILHFCSSMISGLVTSAASLPVDIIKTRVQFSGKSMGQLQALKSIIKNEGVLALWSGFLPTYLKIGPHTVLTFIFLEQLNSLYFKMKTLIVEPKDPQPVRYSTMEKRKTDRKPSIPTWMNFIIGGTSGMMAITIVQPNDLLKTRMQLLGPACKNTNMFQVARELVTIEGVGGLYKGLTAALFRQATYTTTRLGVFNGLLDYHESIHGVPNYGVKLLMGMIAGGIGAYVGTPAEVALIRTTADSRLPPEKRRNYSHVFNALARIVREEGVSKLWRGASATVTRGMVVNAAQLGTYAQAREVLVPYCEGIFLHFCASMISGLVTTAASLPVDIIKTRVQFEGKGMGQLQVSRSILKHEGFFALWCGFLPTYMKIGPATVFTFIFLEQLNAFYLRTMEP